ncbi:MAG: serine/threonine protein kinase, partial [Methanosarcinales archaeon]
MVVVCATTSMKWSSGLEVIDTVAGTGVLGFNGDGITATAARLYNPAGVSALYNASSDGVVLFISDSYSHRIRRVNEGGIITTVVGTGAQGYSGDGGAATAARLRFPRGLSAMSSVSVGSVDMYIADFSNHCVRHVNNAGIITTVAGNGTLGFSGDGGPATAAQLHEPWDVSALYNASSGGVVLYVA